MRQAILVNIAVLELTLFVCLAHGQTSTPPPQSTSGPCSPIINGNGNTATCVHDHDWAVILDGDKQKDLIRALEKVTGKFRLEWQPYDASGVKMAGFLSYAFLQAKWTPNQIPNYFGSICYPTKEFDCSGLRITVKNKKSDVAKTAVAALSASVPWVRVDESDTVPDDQVNMLVTTAP